MYKFKLFDRVRYVAYPESEGKIAAIMNETASEVDNLYEVQFNDKFIQVLEKHLELVPAPEYIYLKVKVIDRNVLWRKTLVQLSSVGDFTPSRVWVSDRDKIEVYPPKV